MTEQKNKLKKLSIFIVSIKGFMSSLEEQKSAMNKLKILENKVLADLKKHLQIL